jgi:hypothetical protein
MKSSTLASAVRYCVRPASFGQGRLIFRAESVHDFTQL